MALKAHTNPAFWTVFKTPVAPRTRLVLDEWMVHTYGWRTFPYRRLRFQGEDALRRGRRVSGRVYVAAATRSRGPQSRLIERSLAWGDLQNPNLAGPTALRPFLCHHEPIAELSQPPSSA